MKKVFDIIKDKDVFIHCRDTNASKYIDGVCKYTRNELSVFQVLEHYIKKHPNQNGTSNETIQLQDAVIIVMINPNYDSTEERTKNFNPEHYRVDRRDEEQRKTANTKIMSYLIRDIKELERKRILQQIQNIDFEHSDTNVDIIDENEYSESNDTFNELVEMNTGFKPSRLFRPKRWFRGNRYALKSNEKYEWNKPDTWKNNSFSQGRYGGTQRLKKRKSIKKK